MTVEAGKQHHLRSRDICGIVVTYHPDAGFPERIKRIVDQIGKVVIVDNHSSHASLEMLKKISYEMGIALIANDKNLGIATALNQGIRYASNCGYAWALTLDQDSVPYPTMVQILISSYSECPCREKVGIIGSNYHDPNTGRSVLDDQKYNSASWQEMKELATSGSLMSIPIFNAVGHFREDFFIDGVDQEYCLRLVANGYKVIIASEPGMIHSVGGCQFKKFLSGSLGKLNHPPVRSYYIARNNLFLVREYFRRETGFACRVLFRLAKRFVATLLLEENKALKIKYLLLGIWHALLSKRGKVSE